MAKLNVVSLVAFLAGLVVVIEGGDFIIFNEIPPTVHVCGNQRQQVLDYWAECELNIPFDECPLKRRRSVDVDIVTDFKKEPSYTKFDDRLIEAGHHTNNFLKFGKSLYTRLQELNLEKLDEKCCMPPPMPAKECEMLPQLCPGGSMFNEALKDDIIKGGCEIFIEENL
ncbi:hypothetical protein TrispH2_010965 [Trichoplax sp. H2]|uniref:Expressed protein n=1 Tax=Trichoplax adhaerens TaxID=10228 RepID=B3SA63_TRIAD|nr:expressed protein [Trichoplax adhaerens]EDV20379.1 expressed protein [Trichoplax adhaerens]RDD37629.1 hypothetical protein TrispH2_010965 [Trichoplax sp. H2]|eukprot:XP_002117073.1 expressed protein [Trichoplax adhaerens]